MSPTIVEEYWSGVARQLQVEADTFSRLVAHNAESGRANELALGALVESLLPSHVRVGTGIVIDSHGGRSKQMDLVVYDRTTQPQILAQSTQLLFPVETVHVVVEVKSSVSERDIDDAYEKFSSLQALQPINGFEVPASAFFGYIATGSPVSSVRQINGLGDSGRPSLACILNPGIAPSAGPNSPVGLVPLHEHDDTGARISGAWVSTDSGEKTVVHAGNVHPVSRFELRGEKYLFEPGRALLLFAESLSSVVATRLGYPNSWLSAYLTDIARETFIPKESGLPVVH
ncbi:DUF6602 domain-containing protein [Glutamicibacter nicotianae]|uniref:DUF6602 domain-containing protein n=1 Tax=Glutamicibacter nicotianae TaxID=37929 RepID=A0ABQ0RJV0_GLUNI|nr:DUF6602 domain-containing protein [Glutamicibacter nicotianae]GEC12093.1 hypothetical protein ANI01nite_12960 [Glutamicibacter nicotianae]